MKKILIPAIAILTVLFGYKSAHAVGPEIWESYKNNITQLVIVQEKSALLNDRPTLTTWEYMGESWHMVHDPMSVAVGRNGLAPLNEKKEGDGRTPSGKFSLKTAFGYDDSVKTGLLYRQATEQDFWIDDVNSPQYNQWVVGKPAAKSFERMKRDDDLYKYGIVIEYNVDPIIPGNGSAIFMHVWRNENSPTSGCIALSEANIIKILKWLDKDQNPVIILGRE